MKLLRKTYAQIDLGAYKQNLKALSTNASNKIMAVVKADAYGHGAVEISHAAIEAGARALAIALPEEAIELRAAGINVPIIVMGRANDDQAQLSVELGLEQCVFSEGDFFRAQALAKKLGKKAMVHIKVDTGMCRIGIRNIDALKKLLQASEKCPEVHITGMFTHFACADEQDKSFSIEQYKKFSDFVECVRKAGHKPLLHAANSASCIDMPQYALDYTRCGIASYGYYPSDEVKKDEIKLVPVMQVFAEISQVKQVEASTPVGYNSTYKVERPAVIATVQIGYGDGYSRLLSNRGSMLLKMQAGYKRAKILGRVCMDQTMIDVTDIGGVKEGDSVIILGGDSKEGIWADDIARQTDTISYEVLLSFSKRVPRVFV